MRRSTHAAVIALAMLALGSLVGVNTVSAELEQATIDPTAARAIGGSYAVVTGTISCTAGETFQINLTMGQSATGTHARGSTTGSCTGDAGTWKVTALTRLDDPLLQPGLSRVCWNAATYRNGERADTRQGCRTLTLTESTLEAAR
ncbi:MAG: hypothetical protein AB7R89_02215 [Dehalococcoidia bacterium]